MKILHKVFFILIVVLVPVLSASCSFFARTQAVEFAVPEYAGTVPVEQWRICVACGTVDGDGNVFREYSVPAGGALLLDLPKNYAAAVLAYPLAEENVADADVLKPWGAVFPWYTELAEQDGFAATVLYRLYRSADYSLQSGDQIRDFAGRFNWKRFVPLCRKLSNQWLVDGTRVVQAIAAGKFKKTDLGEQLVE